MSEWLKEAVLKTVVPRGTVGSNPTPSATVHPVGRFIQVTGSTGKIQQPENGEMAELAEGARLLSECRVKALPRVRIPLSPPYFNRLHQIQTFIFTPFFDLR